MKITIPTEKKNLDKLMAFARDFLRIEFHTQHDNNLFFVALEEIFTNIASYAFDAEGGSAELELVRLDSGTLRATFRDAGRPFDPVAFDSSSRAQSSLDELSPGGLGIYLVKNTMQNLTYARVDGCNVFSFEWAVE